MFRFFLSFFILLFWVVMTIYFLNEEIFIPPTEEGYRPQLTQLKAEEVKEEFTVYFQQLRLGKIILTTIKEPEGNYRLLNETQLRVDKDMPESYSKQALLKGLEFFGLPGLELEVRSEVKVDKNYQVKEMFFELKSNAIEAQIKGKVEGDRIRLVVEQDGEELEHMVIPIQKAETLAQGLMPFQRMKDLKIGKHWKMVYVNPITKSHQTLEARVTKLDQLTINGNLVEAFLVKTKAGLFEVKTWMEVKEGHVLKVEFPFKIRIERELKTKAKKNPTDSEAEEKKDSK